MYGVCIRPETRKRIKELGYKGYSDYLRSQHWAKFRAGWYRRNTRACWICGVDKRLTLHHIDYSHIGAERDSDVICLCITHHRGVHSFMKARRVKVEVAHFFYREWIQAGRPKKRKRRSTTKRRTR